MDRNEIRKWKLFEIAMIVGLILTAAFSPLAPWALSLLLMVGGYLLLHWASSAGLVWVIVLAWGGFFSGLLMALLMLMDLGLPRSKQQASDWRSVMEADAKQQDDD